MSRNEHLEVNKTHAVWQTDEAWKHNSQCRLGKLTQL